MIDLSIIVLAYQEAKRIGSSLDQLADWLKAHDYGQVEVLVVVPNSPDGTADIARSKAQLFSHFRVIDAGPRQGKGRDTRLGMLEAKGRYRLFMDADLATPLNHLDDVHRLMQSEAKVGICVRDLSSSHTGVRKFISSFGNLLVQLILLPGIKDTQCGFKVFEAEAAEQIFRRQTVLSWGFDMEVLAIARQLGYQIELIDTPDWHDVAGGTFKNVAVTGALQTFKDLLSIKIKQLMGKYKHPHYR
jgi:dolichyl-phosphate beta-glucosyltransferase